LGTKPKLVSLFKGHLEEGPYMRVKGYLSYGEIVIIAIVLGVVGRAISPRSSEANVSALVDGLSEMRTQLDLYRAEHDDKLPPTDTFSSFEAAMTRKAGGCGPYVKKIPANPFNKLKTVRFDGEPAGAGKAGWRFDTKTGAFQADNEPGYANL
jgi:type II secretory pathway pseudopilin PulG